MSWSWRAPLQTTVPAWPHRSSGCTLTTCLTQSSALNTWPMTTLRYSPVPSDSHRDPCTMDSFWVAGSIIPTPLWCMSGSSHWTLSVSSLKFTVSLSSLWSSFFLLFHSTYALVSLEFFLFFFWLGRVLEPKPSCVWVEAHHRGLNELEPSGSQPSPKSP